MKKSSFLLFQLLLLSCFIFLGLRGIETDKEPFAFVILRHIKSSRENYLWKRCYTSIQKFYPKTRILIIDDASVHLFYPDKGPDCEIIKSQFPGAGEILPYYYFYRLRWAQKMIFLHDSMLLRRAFTDEELSPSVKFHWHFEPNSSDENFRIERLLHCLKHPHDLIFLNSHKSLWCGCFGSTSIIDIHILDLLEQKYGFPSALVTKIHCREDRMALERVFGLLLFKEGLVTKDTCSNFGCIHHYPHAWENINDWQLEELKTTYWGAILKTWHGR